MKGRASGLDEDTIQRTLERTERPEHFRPIAAPSQTDFTVAGIDKGVGLRALVQELDGSASSKTPSALAFAIGDSVADAPMFALADRAFAPSNADPELRKLNTAGSTRIEFVRRPTQAGLLVAVRRVLGHQPGTCDVCAPPPPSAKDTRLLLATFGMLDGGRREKAKQTLLLAAMTGKLASTRRDSAV
jgi:hypothetical protein